MEIMNTLLFKYISGTSLFRIVVLIPCLALIVLLLSCSKEELSEAPSFMEIKNTNLSKVNPNSGHKNDKHEGAMYPKKIIGTTNEEIAAKEKTYVGECVEKINIDLDHDGMTEIVCPRRVVEQNDRSYSFSFLIDVFKKEHHSDDPYEWILRQKCDKKFYGEEKFFDIEDIYGDKTPELITKLKIGSDCISCEAYRIYSFEDGIFQNMINLFCVDPYNTRYLLERMVELQEYTLSYAQKISNEKVYYWSEYTGFSGSEIWLIDSDHDEKMEVVQLLEPLKDDQFSAEPYHLMIMELSSEGRIISSGSHFVKMDNNGSADILGFLKTRQGKHHILLHLGYIGTSVSFPVLRILQVQGTQVKNIGELYGFYDHVISERIKDLDHNGNSEIIYAGDAIWPPGSTHADIQVIYSIAEFDEEKGVYVQADEKFKREYKRLNRDVH